MQPMNNYGTVPCPNCGTDVKLEQHPTKENRLIAYHTCSKLGNVPVYETDKPVEKVSKAK